MLIFANGAQAGTLGGGCVEAEVRRRALEAVAQNKPLVVCFQLDHDYGWDDGLICGGRMQAVIEPLYAQRLGSYFERLESLHQAGAPFTEVVQFAADEHDGELPVHVLFDRDRQPIATIPTRLPAERVERARQNLRSANGAIRPYAVRGFAYLPVACRCRLVIVGGGHVGKAVGDLAHQLDFDVWIVEDREEFASPERFPYAQRRIVGKFDQVLANLEITPDTYCLIVTRGHNHDARALYYVAQHPARYIGLIGSRRKIRVIFEDLIQDGISAEVLSGVYAPVGVDIGSQTVAEIAVSIVAELVAHRNRGGEVPGRPAGVAVHSGAVNHDR